MRSGDFVARSNFVESAYCRVNPDDLDNDGWLNEVDANPLVFNEGGFGFHWPITLTFVSAGGPRLLFAPRLGAGGGGAALPQVEPTRRGI